MVTPVVLQTLWALFMLYKDFLSTYFHCTMKEFPDYFKTVFHGNSNLIRKMIFSKIIHERMKL